MKVSVNVEIDPFVVPKHVYIPHDDPMYEGSRVPLSCLDTNTLEMLCSEFRREVFKTAGKEQPPGVDHRV